MHQILFVGDPNLHNNSKMADDRHLENRKITISQHSGLSDQHEILHNDTH